MNFDFFELDDKTGVNMYKVEGNCFDYHKVRR